MAFVVGFVVGTPKKVHHFVTSSASSKLVWFDELRKLIFNQKKRFNEVSICWPLPHSVSHAPPPQPLTHSCPSSTAPHPLMLLLHSPSPTHAPPPPSPHPLMPLLHSSSPTHAPPPPSPHPLMPLLHSSSPT